MKRYDEKVLHALLDKYERSLLYAGQNKRGQTIRFSVGKGTLPEYFDETSQEYSVIHMQLSQLEEMGFVRLVWKNKKVGHILEQCILVPERAEEIYRYLGRSPRSSKEAQIEEICSRFLGKDPVLDRFLAEIQERTAERRSLKQYVNLDAPKELEQLCQTILTILNNREELFLRELSVRSRNDSKAMEKEISQAVNLIVRFSGRKELQGLTAEQVLEEFHIYKNPSWVMVKGRGVFQMADGKAQISLADFPGGLGLTSRDIEAVRWHGTIVPERIVTIENLTSFHRWKEENTLAIYLGGYHNSVKRRFLQKIYEAYPQADYLHYGDMDCGGFRIWKDLCEKTGIAFVPWRMDEQTYLQYLDYGRPLSERDRKELERMGEDPFFKEQKSLFLLMLKKGIKIEQEVMCETAKE